MAASYGEQTNQTSQTNWIATLGLSPECSHELFVKQNYLHGECLKLLASKVIGYTIVAATSLFVKIPQIIKIVKARSGEGINLGSMSIDLLTLSGNVSYNFVKSYPFSVWGEAVFMALQTLLIAVLILAYRGHHRSALTYLVVYFVAMSIMLSSVTPVVVHVTLQMLTVPLIIFSRLLQMWTIYQRGNTGQISGLSYCLRFFRSSGRLYTNIMETGDPVRILIYVTASACNTALGVQFLYYNPPIKRKERMSKSS